MGHIKNIQSLIMTIVIVIGFIFSTNLIPMVTSKPAQQNQQLVQDSDNSFSAATELFNNVPVTGSVDPANDQYDYYKIKLRRVGRDADYMQLNLSITDPFGGLILVTFFNPEEYMIGRDLVLSPGRNPLLRNFHACYPGFYYIRVEANPFNFTNYAIILDIITRRITTDSDNTNSTAATIGPGSIPSSLRPETDYLDLYNISLTVDNNTSQGFEATMTEEDNAYLAVYKPDGTLRMLSDFLFSSSEDEELVKFAADQNGTYRIAVGISAAPTTFLFYFLNISVTSGIPPDKDYSEELATRVYDGTRLTAIFGSEFDVYDYYVMELNQSDNLTVSIEYESGGPGDLNIEIYEPGQPPINKTVHNDPDPNKGVWTYGIADKDQTDYYIKVQNLDLDKLVNYTISFSLDGDNLLFEPMLRNNTALDFSMLEDTVDQSHVNLSDIFYDPDSTIVFDSPSHPNGIGENIDIEILQNHTVKFMPHKDFVGSERVNFSAMDDRGKKLYWEVLVTVLPVNDPPKMTTLENQFWTQDSVVDIKLIVIDVDNTSFTFTDNTTLFDVDAVNTSIRFTPINDQVGIHHINITASDGEFYSSIHFTAMISNVNDPPQFISVGGKNANITNSLKLDAYEDAWNNYTITVLDPDREIGILDVLQFSTDFVDPAFNIDKNIGNISFYPLQKHVGIVEVKITVSDNNDGQSSLVLNITVFNVNDAPVILSGGATVINLYVNCSLDEVYDEDGDVLSYIWDFGDGITATSDTAYYGHKYSQKGKYNISATADDGNGGSAVKFFEVELTQDGAGDGSNNGNGNGNGNDTEPKVDSDKDGLPDDWELKYFGNLTYDKDYDYDKDGYTNLEEYQAGTDPTRATDRPLDDKKDEEKEDQTNIMDPNTLFYLLGIIILIVIIIILLLFIFITRKRDKDEFRDERYRSGQDHDAYGDEMSISCPECGEWLFADENECPRCGFIFDDEYEDGSEYERDYEEDYDHEDRSEDVEWDKDYDEKDEYYEDEDYGEEYDDGYNDYDDENEYYKDKEYDVEYDEEYNGYDDEGDDYYEGDDYEDEIDE